MTIISEVNKVVLNQLYCAFMFFFLVEYSEPIRILNPTTETAEIAKLAEYAESAESVESAEFAKSADTVESSETLVAAKSTTKSKEIQTNTKEVTFKKVEDSKQ